MSQLDSGIAIIHGNKLETLVNVLEHWLKNYPLTPLENDVFLVYNNGVGQWLKQHLAKNESLGIAAGLEIQLPSLFIWRIYRAVLGQKIPKEQPLARTPLLWRLYRLLPTIIKKEGQGFEILGHFLKGDEQGRKRYQLAEKLAELFDQYQVYRADWLTDWEKGHYRINDGHGRPHELLDEHHWQVNLWREILADVGSDSEFASRSFVHDQFMAQIDGITQAPTGLPSRIILFGLPTLPQQHLEVLAKMGKFCQIILFVTNPCQHYWADIIEDKELLKAQQRRQSYKDGMSEQIAEDDLHLFANPLLAAWGKQGRDYVRLLDQFDSTNHYKHWNWPNDKIDFFDDYASPPTSASLLHRLQQSILDLEPLPENPELIEQDSSLVFHIAHSPQREIEILHDQLLHRFNAPLAEGETRLKPREVIVMVPDINQYAPHIHAVFGQIGESDKRAIPYSLTDQEQRGENTLLVALEYLLDLPRSRFGASEILWLLEVPAIRSRFGLEESALPRLQQWTAQAGVRWGVDEAHRKNLNMQDGLNENTWQFGFKRMLLGYAVGVGEAFRDIEPYEEIGGIEAKCLGSVYALLEKLEHYAKLLKANHSAEQWFTLLPKLLEDFFLATEDKERKTLDTLIVSLAKWQQSCILAKLGEDKSDGLSVAIVKETWLSSVDEPGFQKIFLTGKVNFCTLMPMRSIPFPVVCILGMNDGDFPRNKAPQSFDLMSLPNHYRPGDRSRRQDDQYVFLEALLSARKQLYISWVGRSIRDNTVIPPSVLISQLRETISKSWCLIENKNVSLINAITLEHPLQPFSLRYIEKERDARLFTYAHEWFAQTSIKNNTLKMKNVATDTHLQLPIIALGRFLRAPVKTYCIHTLKFNFENSAEELRNDDEPFDFNHLEQYQFRDELLSALKASDAKMDHLDAFFEKQQTKMNGQGLFPLGHFKEITFDDMVTPVKSAWLTYQHYLEQWPTVCESVNIKQEFSLANGVSVQLSGQFNALRQNGKEHALIVCTAQTLLSKGVIKYHNFCNHWVNHLLLCATQNPLQSIIIGSDTVCYIPSLSIEQSTMYLRQLLESWQNGLQKPLSVAAKTAFAYLPEAELANAKLTYEGNGFNSFGELGEDAYLQRFYPNFDSLISSKTFEVWAEVLYLPMLLQIMKVAQ
jgi:exodeoxyribonuclease V gamma subunit